MKSPTTPKARVRFAVCVKNKEYRASLEIGKLYRVIPDVEAEGHGYLRIIDESGEDYGYTVPAAPAGGGVRGWGRDGLETGA